LALVTFESALNVCGCPKSSMVTISSNGSWILPFPFYTMLATSPMNSKYRPVWPANRRFLIGSRISPQRKFFPPQSYLGSPPLSFWF
jgi:hypothetical protein